MSRSFKELLKQYDYSGTKKKVAVVWAGERHTLEAVIDAYRTYGVEPVLIGNIKAIANILAEMGCTTPFEQISTESPEEAILTAISLVHQKKVDILFKGLMQTATIMQAIVNKENGICKSGVLSHVSLLEIPGYHKIVGLTDSALLTYPTIEQKKEIIRNAVKLLHATGVEKPKIAILAAVEEVNHKMPETVEAAKLKEMGQNGEIADCIIEGPISYDLAMDPEAASIKGYNSLVAGDADILVVPNIQAGNILVKCLLCSAHAVSSGLIMGAAVPIIITSRSAPVANKSNAIAVAAALGNL